MNSSEENPTRFKLLAEQSAEENSYAGGASRDSSNTYQSEAALEKQLIKDLQAQGYEELLLPKGEQAVSEALLLNLRKQIEKLNAPKLVDGVFSDDEWVRLQRDILFNPKDSFVDRARILREPFSFRLDNYSEPNLMLLSSDPNDNSYQVVSQVESSSGFSVNRYDVSILVNGLPLLHIELKRRGISIGEAFKQINRYRRESMTGLYSWVQLFVGSNGTTTRYWSNTVKELSRKNQEGDDIRRVKVPGFEFTSHWADKDNKRIHDLSDFTNTFLQRRQLGRTLYDYCVLDTNNTLKVLRPYQVHAIQAALERAHLLDPNIIGTTAAGGYIWHTTGSGKTLTSFVLAKILSRQQTGESKVIFAVDRQDLDAQTKREFNSFAPGSVDGNKDTSELQKQLLDPNTKIIVTTIQKLATLAKRVKTDPRLRQKIADIAKEEMVIIYDECHRSQFGKSHGSVKRMFPRHRIFGFTGTPIFSENAQKGKAVEQADGQLALATTEALFGKCLHTYTIVNAIDDGNVLKFKIDTQAIENNNKDYYDHPDRMKAIVKDIVENHDRRTHNRAFNSILATSSVSAATAYYRLFKEYNQELEKKRAEAKGDKVTLAAIPKPLRIATVFTYGANNNEQAASGDLYSINEEDLDQVEDMSKSDRQQLYEAIEDYNAAYGTNFSLGEFKMYKDDISWRMKSHKSASQEDIPFEIDLLIVVNIFLTGFDAPTLNTLYVDKELAQHGLIQAFSRTNRILNSQKSHGEIVCYRDLRDEIDQALRLFGQTKAEEIILLPSYEECRASIVKTIHEVNNLGEPGEILDLQREREKKAFVKAWTKYLRELNTISTFGAYEDEPEGEARLADRKIQDYSSVYHDLYDQFLENDTVDDSSDDLDEDVTFDISLLKTIEVNIDYILDLIGELAEVGDDEEKKQAIREDIEVRVGASASLREKRVLISDFIEEVIESTGKVENIYQDFQTFVDKRGQTSIEKVCTKYGMDLEDTKEFLSSCLLQREFVVAGQNITGLKLSTTKIGLGPERDRWKAAVEKELEYIYSELVNIIENLD